jgi:hypothetical protein
MPSYKPNTSSSKENPQLHNNYCLLLGPDALNIKLAVHRAKNMKTLALIPRLSVKKNNYPMGYSLVNSSNSIFQQEVNFTSGS